jgi:fibronectin type 3 domain-containing protein
LYLSATDPDGEVVSISLSKDGNEVVSEFFDYIYYTWFTENESLGEHQFEVVATDDKGKNASLSFIISLDPVSLATPVIESIGSYSGRLSINWSRVDKATYYNIYWTDNGLEPSENSNVIKTDEEQNPSTYYNHEDLDFTKTYKYRVQAGAGDFTSDLSASKSAQPEIAILEPPSNFNAIFENGRVNLTWDEVDFEGVKYEIQRKPGTEYYFSTLAEDITQNSYQDNTWEAGKGYQYAIRAVDDIYSRTSQRIESDYILTEVKVLFEQELNNEDCGTSLNYDTHYWDAETTTEELDWFRIKGGYTGQYSIYSAASYRNYEADCFVVELERGDRVEFSLISGDMNGLWSMSAKVMEYGQYSTGNDREVQMHEFYTGNNTYEYRPSSTGSVFGVYLQVSMWDDLINFGPYNYEVEFKIIRD